MYVKGILSEAAPSHVRFNYYHIVLAPCIQYDVCGWPGNEGVGASAGMMLTEIASTFEYTTPHMTLNLTELLVNLPTLAKDPSQKLILSAKIWVELNIMYWSWSCYQLTIQS